MFPSRSAFTTVLLNNYLDSNGNGCSSLDHLSDDQVHSMLERDNRNVSPLTDANNLSRRDRCNESTNDLNSAEDFR